MFQIILLLNVQFLELSMKTQLQGVIQQMDRVNKNIIAIKGEGQHVSNVAKLWRESYQIANEISKSKTKECRHSSTPLVIYRGGF